MKQSQLRKPQYKMQDRKILLGTSIMVRHKPNVDVTQIPFFKLTGTTYDGKKFEQKTNMVKFIPLIRSTREKNESARQHFDRDYKVYSDRLKDALKEFADIGVYELHKYKNTSVKIKLR